MYTTIHRCIVVKQESGKIMRIGIIGSMQFTKEMVKVRDELMSSGKVLNIKYILIKLVKNGKK